MTDQTEREKFSTLATDINRALERNDDEEYYRLTHSHPDEILKALRLAALDGGAVAAVKKVRDGYADQARFADVDAASYFREFIRRIDAALRTPPQRDGGAVSQDVELAALRRQLAEREAEVERLRLGVRDTDIVKSVLSKMGVTFGTSDVRVALEEQGDNLGGEKIHNALQNLVRSGFVTHLGYGRWGKGMKNSQEPKP